MKKVSSNFSTRRKRQKVGIMQTIKTDKTVALGEVVLIPSTRKVKQEENMFNWATKMHIPGEMNYLTWINLSTATLDPSAPNARNKHKQPHLVRVEKKMNHGI
jgi:ribosomal protein L16 Arg81 hydroxylase